MHIQIVFNPRCRTEENILIFFPDLMLPCPSHVDHLRCESLICCSPSVHVRGLALSLPPFSAFTAPKFGCWVSCSMVSLSFFMFSENILTLWWLETSWPARSSSMVLESSIISETFVLTLWVYFSTCFVSDWKKKFDYWLLIIISLLKNFILMIFIFQHLHIF